MTAEEKILIRELKEDVAIIKTVIVGVPETGDTGLVGDMKEIKESCLSLNTRHNKLSQRFWLLVGVLSGSGVLGAGIYGLLNGVLQ